MTAKHSTSDPRSSAEKERLAQEVADRLSEWRKTCSLMGMRWTDKDAAAFVAEGLAYRLPSEVSL